MGVSVLRGIGICIERYWYLYWEVLVFVLRGIGICIERYWYLYWDVLVFVLRGIGICIETYWYLYWEVLVFVLRRIGICIETYWYLYWDVLVFVLRRIGICIGYGKARASQTSENLNLQYFSSNKLMHVMSESVRCRTTCLLTASRGTMPMGRGGLWFGVCLVHSSRSDRKCVV